jgi:hypothetical protein
LFDRMLCSRINGETELAHRCFEQAAKWCEAYCRGESFQSFFFFLLLMGIEGLEPSRSKKSTDFHFWTFSLSFFVFFLFSVVL